MSLTGHLAPDESLGEVLAGLVMVLTFTLAAGVATRGGQDGVWTLLFAAVGCNLAWGIIDAVFYVMTRAFVRRRHARLIRAVRAAPNDAAALGTIRRELEPDLHAIALPADREQLYRSIYVLLANGTPAPTSVTREDLIGALAILCLVFVTTLPAVLPFVFIRDAWLALRISNLLLIGSLFIVGFRWAKHIDASPWLAGIGLTGLGLALVAVAMALGG